MVVYRRRYRVYSLNVWQHGASRKVYEYEFLDYTESRISAFELCLLEI